MSNSSIIEQEGALLDLIGELGILAWRKYQQRYPDVWVNNQFQREDRSGYPPFVSFRFEKEDINLINKLKHSVESFDGAVDWVMGEHKRIGLPGTNWVICPRRLWEIVDSSILPKGMSAGQYMAEHDAAFGTIAYEDLTRLTSHLRRCFSRLKGS